MEIEIRSGQGLRAASQGRLEGYAAVFNAPSHDLGGFREIIRNGAFRHTLADAKHVRALYDHDSRQVLGRVGANTLRLREMDAGLFFELDLPRTSYAKDLTALVERGDVSGCSFAFRVRENGDRWTRTDDGLMRELLDLELSEITITANPAYPDTTVAKRSIPLSPSVKTMRLWLDTCK